MPVGPQKMDEAPWRGGMRLAASSALDRLVRPEGAER